VVEQPIRNRQVASSTLALGSIPGPTRTLFSESRATPPPNKLTRKFSRQFRGALKRFLLRRINFRKSLGCSLPDFF
jgi:hypothetical protein